LEEVKMPVEYLSEEGIYAEGRRQKAEGNSDSCPLPFLLTMNLGILTQMNFLPVVLFTLFFLSVLVHPQLKVLPVT